MQQLTPGMKQYMDIKNANPDCIILFRMGDFYETFFEDAKTIARELEITLTSRGKGDTKAPLAGIPYHAIEPYIAKLVKKGYKVGMVEQTEDPKKAKGLVKRELVRIITPGTVVESIILDKNKNNYILNLIKDNENFTVSFCDISTGEFLTTQVKENQIINEITRIKPAEIIIPTSLEQSNVIEQLKNNGFQTHTHDDRFFYLEKAKETLQKHFDILNFEGFGIRNQETISSCGGLLSYIKETQMNSLTHINKIKVYHMRNFMFLDSATIRNLELLKNIIDKGKDASLISVIDKTVTPMGKRLLRKWITSPLISKIEITLRINSVEELKNDVILRHELSQNLKNVYDIERLIGKIAFGNANPKDLIALGESLKFIPKIKELLTNVKNELLKNISNIPDLTQAKEIIFSSIKQEPATTIREGNIIKRGYNQELDELRNITIDAKSYLAEMEEQMREDTKIKSLKIKYNKVIGYYIEITKSNLELVPEYFIRKQSQVNSERFITEDLKEMESKILGAQERIYQLEYDIFMEILEKLREFISPIQETADKISVLDCLNSFAFVSQNNNYCKPEFSEDKTLEIIDSRHPVVEEISKIDFISNDCSLDAENTTMIITGPNMAGKSTYLRQIALTILMAQIGCFVPAKYAKFPITDRVFSRIGAYDDLVNAQSTFMVEMNEAANILNNATQNSFVILDEIGRGTSTYDGVSLAWAITEYLNNKIKCKTLFATHYHHLNSMETKFNGIKNYQIAVEEQNDEIIFLRKILRGGTNKSYGIQVAKLAGIPNEVITNAKNVMQSIESQDKLEVKLNGDAEEKIEDKIIEKPNNELKDKIERLSKELDKIKDEFS